MPASGPFREQKLTDKFLSVKTYHGAVVPLEKELGVDSFQIWVDPDRTKIDFLGQRKQVKNALGIYSPFRSAKIQPEPGRPEKHDMLQVADAFAYFGAKALSPHRFPDKAYYWTLYQSLGAPISWCVYNPDESQEEIKPPRQPLVARDK